MLPARRRRDRSRRARRALRRGPSRRSRSCRCTDRSTRRSRIARSTPAAARRVDPRDQHRRDVAHGAGRLGGGRHRAAQSRALRRGARHRQSRDRAHHRGLRRSAGRPRRPSRAGRRDPAVESAAIGCGRTASRRSSASICRARCSTILGWGGDPRSFDWFEPPPADRLGAALALLERLGAVDRAGPADRARPADAAPAGQSRGCRAILLAARRRARSGTRRARCCRSVTIGRRATAIEATTSSDLLTAVERERDLPRHVVDAADALQRCCSAAPAPATARRGGAAPRAARRLSRSRRAQRARRGSPRVLLRRATAPRSDPRAACATASSWWRSTSPPAGAASCPRRACAWRARSIARGCRRRDTASSTRSIRQRASCAPCRATTTTRFRSSSGRRGRIPTEAARLLVDAFLERPLRRGDEQLAAAPAIRRPRSRRARRSPTRRRRPPRALSDCRSRRGRAIGRSTPPRRAGADVAAGSERPTRAARPTRTTGRVVAAVKLQELFGLADTPRVGPRRSRCCCRCSRRTAGRCS